MQSSWFSFTVCSACSSGDRFGAVISQRALVSHHWSQGSEFVSQPEMWVNIVVYYGPCSKLLSVFSAFFFFFSPTKATTPFPIQPGNSRWGATLWIVPPLKSNLSIYSFTCRIVLFLVFLSLLHQSSTPFWPYLPSIRCFIKKDT